MNVTPQTTRKVVGMDMRAPYGVYVDGVEVARHNSESEAAALFNRLAGRTLPSIDAMSAATAGGVQ
ncbi:hypothetical protein [Rhodoferax mekongensis]|uniref:hypothetical protein n=1 Tax=Rhodoferax mekongensis TaxID=3068341 RepID=UPI0028BE733B|nr:hypothetical protein [Rhodoferax sp. TBRC 17199]MDT7514558.1 hypothetical protein [Rhodoferax sp. TBRC 17199]